MKSYTITLEEDKNGDLILPLLSELVDGQEPWLLGDDIVWTITDGVVSVINRSWIQRNNPKNNVGSS